jgi:EAL domain-containing protein (putative c-di-GMP-specific phosphodiesterase class I)
VLAESARQWQDWNRQGIRLDIAVNLSAVDLLDLSLVGEIAALLAHHDMPPECLVLEITERTLLQDEQQARDILTRLNSLGIRVSIDDYGTGYSSLAYLRRLPVHELKIDKTFILGMARDTSDAVIVRSTIDLAHHMGLMVVAEGVEDEATVERLRGLNCDMVQGYLLSRPLAAAELVVWMRGSVWTRAARDPALLRRVG